jgi:hypothetical protein
MKLDPKALSQDGYIIDQRRTNNISFGGVNSDRNGCGWIACYNLLKALDRDVDPEDLLLDLERTLILDGWLGLNLFALVWELKKQHLPLDFAVTSFHAHCLSQRCRAGIILYFTGRRNHFAAFRREADGSLRFFGAVPGRADHRCSMAEFYWDYVKFPLAVTITAR